MMAAMQNKSLAKRLTLPGQFIATALGYLLLIEASAQAAVVFEDDFSIFGLGHRWQPHRGGAPDVVLTVVGGIGADGSSLRMATAPGGADEILGIQTAEPIPLIGVRLVRVTARLRPLNQTAVGNGGASDASAGVAVVGSNGAFARASAGANRPTSPDWGDFYADSEGSADANAAFVHFPPNDPKGGAEAFRTFVIEITAAGTSLSTLSTSGEPLATKPFDVQNPNLTLESFGATFTVALYQQRSDANGAPENTFGDIDNIKIETVTDADDTDADGIPNTYEIANGLKPDVNDASQDLDGDGLSNFKEFQLGTRANVADTDGDTLGDGVETGTGIYVNAANTGTNPLKADSDNDGLADAEETNTGTFLSTSNTGTNPNAADSDHDGFNDSLEISAGFNPNNVDSTPAGSSSIRTAIEFQFYAAPGVSYRIEGSPDMQNWTTVEATVPGSGNRISRLFSTEGKPNRFFRAIAN